MTENSNPFIDFYTSDGELIPVEEHGDHDLTEGMVSFSGSDPQPTWEMSLTDLKTVQAWLLFLTAENERMSEVFTAALDKFKGYPTGTTIGDIVSGKAQKIMTPVEVPHE